ncbi:MAG: GntR family transcriptional regulator [Ruminococcaceae bacterium]|nr:GntR family transcriptional regulator [Oscillospiraceae bacterium]
MGWQFNGREAVYLQIAARLRSDILMGKYPPDTQIPSVRTLAFEAAVNPNTMQRALAHLEFEGILYSKGTIGRFVTWDTQVLQAARKKMHREYVRKWLSEAEMIGMSTEELIYYIREEDDSNE